MGRRMLLYAGLAAALLLVYCLVAARLYSDRDFGEDGPLSAHSRALAEPLPGAIRPSVALDLAFGRTANASTRTRSPAAACAGTRSTPATSSSATAACSTPRSSTARGARSTTSASS